MPIRKVVLALLLLAAQPLVAQDAPRPIADRYVIDVRSDEEWTTAHIAGAIHVPYKEVGARIAGVLPDKGAPIGLYCGSGKRAGVALETLKALGYTNLENLGGMAAAHERIQRELHSHEGR